MEETKKLKVLQINLRSDYGGGPHHMFQLIKNISPNIETFAAMPREIPYWDLNTALIGEERCFELPHRKFSLIHFFRLLKFVKTNQIKVLHAQGKGASIYGRLISFCSDVSCIYTFHGLHYGKYNWLEKWVYFGIENLLALFTKAFIVVSEGEKKEVLRLIPFSKNKINLIHNGVDIPSSVHSEFPENGDVNVCCIARMDYQKNLELLIPIAKGLVNAFPNRKVSIQILGVDDTPHAFKDLIVAEGLANIISLHGFSRNATLWLQNAHIYLSTSRWEGLPISVLEASALGMPVVVSDVVGNRDALVNGETGFLYPVNEPLKAVEAIVNLLNDKALYCTVSLKAHQLVKESFSVHEMARKIEDLYFSLNYQPSRCFKFLLV